jgi:hypothetical protein
LAQQGYPITEQLQETSDTNGKIYNVQYFERAVFEYHPENAGKPSEVLLQLLGDFLSRQKYPRGAPGATPNNEAGSRHFFETGKRLGGIFLQYWNSHGGLAQQGFPISDEFTEKSDLDGKTYKVQYFERAVFEYHPENAAPFNVLLSQLGTFRNTAKYGNVIKQLSGSSNIDTALFPLKAGLAIFRSVRASDAGYFYIDVANEKGEKFGTIAAGSVPLDLSAVVEVPADGMYRLLVQAEEGWTVNVTQPTAAFAPPPARQRFVGLGFQATPLFSLKAGPATFHIASFDNKDVFRVQLRDAKAMWVGDIASTAGPGEATTTIEIPADGVYIIQVEVDNAWTLEIQQ